MKIILNYQVSKDFVSKLNNEELYREIITLENNDDYKSDDNLHIPEDTIKHCLERKNELINIALAQVVKNSDDLKLLYFTESDIVKKLVLSNRNIKPRVSFNDNEMTFFDEHSYSEFISDAPEEQLMNYFMNNCFELVDFKNIFTRKKDTIYHKISDERWVQILRFISWNKNIKSNVDGPFDSIKRDSFGNFEDGWTWYERGKAEDAPWLLLGHLSPSNLLHIFILEELYTRIAYKIINPSIDSIISIFEKWKYKPEFDQNKKEEKFQKRLDGLRQLLSFKICEGNERRDSIMNYFRTNEDKNLRYGYYQVYDPTKESIIQHFEKDKELFIEAGIENYHFYLRRNEEEIEIADLFFEYKNKIKKEYLDFEYNYKKTTLKQEAPTLFINEEFYDRDLDEGELIKEIDKNSKLIDSILTSKIKDSKEQSEQENVKIIYWLGRQIKFSAELQDKILERIRNIRNLEQQIKEQSAQIQNLKGWAIVALIAVVVLAVLK